MGALFSPSVTPILKTGAWQYGEVAEWSKAIDSKSIVLFLGDRGFESLPLLSVFGSRGGSGRGILPVLNALHKTYKVFGEVAERFKAHAWKACVGLYPTEGSNPSLSARIQINLAVCRALRNMAL